MEIIRKDGAPEGAKKSVAVSLNREEKALLAEALEQCRQAADDVEERVTTLGIWLLQHVFGNQARAALEGQGPGKAKTGDNKVWAALQRRAGGPSLRLNGRILSVALRVAAWDRLIQSDSWRQLDIGRKELMLPFNDPALMREGAEHVTSMGMTQEATREYVHQKLKQEGRAAAPRRLNPTRIVAALAKLRGRYTASDVRRTVRGFAKHHAAEDVKALAKEVDSTIEFLRGLKRDLKGK